MCGFVASAETIRRTSALLVHAEPAFPAILRGMLRILHSASKLRCNAGMLTIVPFPLLEFES